MNKILTGTQAFEALMAGKKIMCRPAGDLLDFDDLDRFPATVFAMPGHEFCIKLEMMELSGIQFAKPLEIHDAQDGQNIFLVTPTCILQTEYNAADTELQDYILNGFVQTDEENAKLQLQAIADLFGRVVAHPMVKTKDTKPKKRRSTKTKNEVEQVDSPALEKQTEPEIIQPEENESIETDPVKLVEKFTAQISQFTNVNEVLAFRHVFLANGYLDQKDQQHLCKLCEDKLLELDPKQYAPKVEQPSNDLSVHALKKLQEEAEKLVSEKRQESDKEYQSLLADLLDRAAKATTPAETTALTGYTKTWTEEQRKPLIDAIHRRLNELNIQKPVEVTEPPSLMVQIQNAPDLTTLDALEIDVSGRHPDIQPKLMGYVKKRRYELEHQNGAAS